MLPFVGISSSDDHSMAIGADGSLWSWGENLHGELGIDYEWFRFPGQMIGDWISPVGMGLNWAYVEASNQRSLAMKDDGTIWSWGNDDLERDFIWTSRNRLPIQPIQIGTDTDWAAIAMAGFPRRSLALKTNGSIWTWGAVSTGAWNFETQRIADNHEYIATPVQIDTDTDWVAISIGNRNHIMAIKNDGTLWGWGDNAYGQIGDGTNIDRHHPVQIGTDTDWVHVTAAWDRTLAMKADGTVWSWGAAALTGVFGDYNASLIGDGVPGHRNSPVLVLDPSNLPQSRQ